MVLFSKDLGIDLGTSNVLIYAAGIAATKGCKQKKLRYRARTRYYIYNIYNKLYINI